MSPLEIKTSSFDVENILPLAWDEQYTLRWIDHTEPTLEPKFDKPEEMQLRFKCDFEIVTQPEGLTHPETGEPLDLAGQRVSDFYTVSLHEKSNFGQVVRAMRGMKPDEKFSDPRFDVDTLCVAFNDDRNGGLFRATLRRKENGYPKIVMPLPVRGAKNQNGAVTGAVPAVDPSEPPF